MWSHITLTISSKVVLRSEYSASSFRQLCKVTIRLLIPCWICERITSRRPLSSDNRGLQFIVVSINLEIWFIVFCWSANRHLNLKAGCEHWKFVSKSFILQRQNLCNQRYYCRLCPKILLMHDSSSKSLNLFFKNFGCFFCQPAIHRLSNIHRNEHLKLRFQNIKININACFLT